MKEVVKDGEVGIEALIEATTALRAEGCDAETIASLFLNGAAALSLERWTEQEFAERALAMRRTTERQVQLIAMLDRATGNRGPSVKPKRSRRASPVREGSAS